MWKYIFGSLMAIAGVAFYARLILLEVWAHDGAGHLHLTRTGAWNVQEQYGSVVFYITESQERLVDTLAYVFIADLIVTFIMVFARWWFTGTTQIEGTE